MNKLGKIAFAIGTGRCGTKFIHELFSVEPQIASSHERTPLNDTFHRYFKWNNLPIDHAGFLHYKEKLFNEDIKNAKISFESSAYLSLSIEELYSYFNAKFILLVRSPEKVVNSYLNKSWYQKKVVRDNIDLPISYQETDHFHHFLGRISPNGTFFREWNEYTRIGKLAWFWNVLNKKVIEQFKSIPEANSMVIKLEDFNYRKYEEVMDFLNVKDFIMTKDNFDKITHLKPNSREKKYLLKDWNENEAIQFEQMVREMSDYFGYNCKFDKLLDKEESNIKQTDITKARQGLFERLKSRFI